MSRETSPSTIDRLPTPEIKTYQEGYTAFKVRAVLGGAALNPDHQLRKEDITKANLGITEETKQDITKVIEAANYNPLANASDAQRLHEAGVTRDQLEAEYNRRSQTFHTILKGDYAEDWNSFMDTFVQKITGKTRDQITVADVRTIYDRYFTGADKHAEVKTYIKDIMALYSKNGKIDYEALKRDREKIQYMAAIFGKEKDEETGGSADEAIAQMIEGHAEVFVDPDGFINQATQEQNSKIRANDFAQGNGKNEKGLQQWLWKYGQPIDVVQPITATPTVVITEPQTKPKPTRQPNPNLTSVSVDTSKFMIPSWPEEYTVSYTDLSGSERTFPSVDTKKELTEPGEIAKHLKDLNPDALKSISTDELKSQIEKQLKAVQREFNELGINEHGVSDSIIARVRDYRQFINEKYLHLKDSQLPYINNLQFFPYSGIAKNLYHKQSLNEPYAFMMPHLPLVFVNVDYIKKMANRFVPKGKSYERMSREEKRQVFERALQEIYPHELTHLTGNLSLWRVDKNGEKFKETPGQVGIEVAKVDPHFKNGEMGTRTSTRLKELNEAVIVELMEKWAQDRKLTLQIPAYTAEREVLQRIMQIMAHEQGVSEDEIFNQFVRGHFTKEGLFHLYKNMSGPINAEGKRPRPYFASIISGLMDYDYLSFKEKNKDIPEDKQPHFAYTTTLAYLNGTLSEDQKIALRNVLVTPPIHKDVEVYFPYSARRELGAQLGIDLPSLTTK